MRTKLIISLGMLTALAVGCSKELPTVNENAWIYDESLPVPIQFGSLSTGMVTKAAVTEENISGNAIGVFAWDEQKAMETSAKSIFPANGYKRAEVLSTDNEDYRLAFKESGSDEKKVYYPMSSEYNYSFYAYHTGTEDIAGVYDEDGYLVNIPFNEPFNDILWGKCAEKDLPYDDKEDGYLPHLTHNDRVIKGFNSRFSRKAAQQGVVEKEKYYPSIELNHICTAFRFYAKADYGMTEDQFNLLNREMKIVSLTIEDVPVSADLVVASTSTDNEGNFINAATGDVQISFEPAPALNETGLTVLNNAPSEEVIPASTLLSPTDGDRFFLPPGDYSGKKFVVGCTLSDSPCTLEFPLTFNGSSVFEAGKCYSFVVIFKALEEVYLKASLSQWEEDFVEIVDPDDEPVDNE